MSMYRIAEVDGIFIVLKKKKFWIFSYWSSIATFRSFPHANLYKENLEMTDTVMEAFETLNSKRGHYEYR